MKNTTILISLLLMGSNLLAKELVDGYILIPNNDTVKCKHRAGRIYYLRSGGYRCHHHYRQLTGYPGGVNEPGQ